MMHTKTIVFALFVILLNSQSIGIPSFLSGQGCCDHNKIVVSGNGVAAGQPDVAKVSIGFEVSSTTSE
ncbi:MAG: hypothetical protein E6Q33_08675 [Neisseriales bacterium]|nr:MAG: hypothetical protein E6Q33_08675 [Neisseriales bacterium]